MKRYLIIFFSVFYFFPVSAQNLLRIWQNQRNYVQDALTQSTISAWYSNAANSNIGKFYQVQQLMDNGSYEAAQTLNQSINATLQPEINQQQYNAIILNRFIRTLNH